MSDSEALLCNGTSGRPITAFLDREVLASSDQSIRRALTPLAALLNRHACAGILVRHLNKFGGSRSLYRGGGSIGFNAACRSSWLFAGDPEDNTRLIMAQIKNNLARPQESLAYRIIPGGTAGAIAGAPLTPILEWLGPSRLAADQLFAVRKNAPIWDRDRAAVFLPEFLAAGPRCTDDIWEAALVEGIGRRTLQDARKRLGISSLVVWNGQKSVTYWLLEGQKLPDTLPVKNRPDDIDDLFTAVRAQYPLDPLDESD